MGTLRASSTVLLLILVPTVALGQIGGGTGSTPGISPQAGPPFPWEGGMQVSPWSTVNLFNGNLITRIPFTSWDDVGPGINFAFYHNSAEGEIAFAGCLGIPFGPGWSMADAGFLVIDSANSKVHVVEDTGLMKTYTEGANDTWLAPTGVYDHLEHDSIADQWTLTRKNQWRRVFDADGHLLYEYDANQQDFGYPLGVGLRKSIVWNSACDCAEPEQGSCSYQILDVNSRYVFIKYFDTSEGPSYDITTSTGEGWYVTLDSAYRPTVITAWHEDDATIQISYVGATDHRIASITDKEGKVWEYEYHATGDHAGKLWKVHDPEVGSTQYHQTFTYSVSAAGYKTTYVDRRSNTWQFLSYAWGGLKEIKDPATKTKQFQYDAAYNRNYFKNELNKIWTAGYDSTGNLTWYQDPLGHKWQFTYDSLNNLTSLTPPLDASGNPNTAKTVTLNYEDEYEDPPNTFNVADPTHLTSIVEPPAASGGASATTTLTYHHSGDGRGELASVTDALGVQTAFEYDGSGGFNSITRSEGPAGWVTDAPSDFTVSESFHFDQRQRLSQAKSYIGHGSFDYTYGAGCTGLSAVGTTDMKCVPADIEPAILPSDPPAVLPSGVDLPFGVALLPHCGVPDLDCGDACWDKMFNVTRFYWPTYGTETMDDSDPPEFTFDKSEREFQFVRDDLYRPTSLEIKNSRPVAEAATNLGPAFTREFQFTGYDGNSNLTTLIDADTSTTTYVYDTLNRLDQIIVGSTTVVDYGYDFASRMTSAVYANGTSTTWSYDDAGRLDKIRHLRGTTLLLELDYAWTPDGLVSGIAQTDSTSTSWGVTFEYDNRGRLIHEYGTIPVCPTGECGSPSAAAVDLEYEYDQLGNRLSKTDNTTTPDPTVTTYEYDVHDANWKTVYGTYNHRLMKETTARGSTVLQKVWYSYTRGGQVKLRVTEYPNDPPAGKVSGTYYMVGMQYNINQQLWLLRLAEKDETGVTKTFAREYRYDGDGRVRYYERDRDPDDLAPIGENTEKWREFLGSSVYSDLDVVEDGGDLASQKSRRYVHAADGQLVAWFDVPDSEHENGQWHFVHADMLGTTRLVTDDAGNVGSGLAYTAFGELAGSAFPGGPAATSRYGYCGGWGYEDDTLAALGGGSSDPVAGLGLLHVGARWYAPGLGRFVQRDPIGVDGGVNAYSYVSNTPMLGVDPSGLMTYDEILSTALQINQMLARITPVVVAGGKLAETIVRRGFQNQLNNIISALGNGKAFIELATGRVVMYYDEITLVLELGADGVWTLITVFEDSVSPALKSGRFVRCQPPRFRTR